MKGIAELRERLGITQQELADFLQMERSTLSLIELSRREFSADALAKLGRLQMADIKSQYKSETGDTPAFSRKKSPASVSSEAMQEDDVRQFNESLSERAAECMQDAERLLAKIRRLEERIQVATHKEKVLRYLKEAPLADAAAAASESRWIAVQEEEVRRCLAPKEKAEIVMLKLRAVALQLEAQHLEQSVIALA